MTKRSPTSVQRPIWFDSMQVDETDLSSEQLANDIIESATINNHVGSGVLPETLVEKVIFDSSTYVGFLDGKAINTQVQPSDNNLGNQLTVTLSNSKVSGHRSIKVCIIGLDFQSNLQYEIFYFKINEIQVSRKHFTKILVLLFNDFIGDPSLSFNLGGKIVITEANPMVVSRDPIMISQDQQPNLFFRDFFLDLSISQVSLQSMLQAALPIYNIDDLKIFTQPLDNLPLLNGDVTTQIGQKFKSTTNNIQKTTFLLSVRNTDIGQENNLAWNGDIIVSIYPLQSGIDCPSDIAPNLSIDFAPSNVPLAQISYNYTSLQQAGILLDSVPQPVDFIFSNSPIANGNVMNPGQYYAVTIKRSGAANQCDILISAGKNLIENSRVTTFTGSLWVDIPDEDLWFKIWTDAAKISDGQGYDTGHGIMIPKTTVDTNQNTVDNIFGQKQFVGNDTFRAVLAAITENSDPIPDQRTGDSVFSRQQYVPQVTLMNTIDISNLEQASEPLILGIISDKNIKFFDQSQSIINSILYTATMAKDEIIIRIVDDPTDTVRFNTTVNGLATNLLNGDLIGARIVTDLSSPTISYRIAEAKLCSMIVGDVDGNGIIDENDLDLLNTYLNYNLNVSPPLHTVITTDGYTTTVTNGYTTLTQPFINLINISFQLVNSTTGVVVASGTNGILTANPSNMRLAQFTSVSVNFNTISGLSSYKLVILNSSVNEANWGSWNITSFDTVNNTLTISKVYLTGDAISQMLRADINGDFVVSYADGYLLNNYIERFAASTPPPPVYFSPSTNPYSKIGTKFNVIKLRLEEFVDRSDDYTSNPNIRSILVHPIQDIFISDGYLASHNFYTSPISFSINKQLVWDESLISTSSRSKLVPSVFTAENGFVQNSCEIDGVQCSIYPVSQDFDPGLVDFFTPNNLIIGNGGELKRPDGDFYKVDFEIGTIVLEIPDGLFGDEKVLDIMSDFIVDYTGSGATRLGFPSMKFADCSFVTQDALSNNQIRFSVSVQSFSPNTNGLSTDGYYGDIVDGKMGVSIDFSNGLLTLNFTNLYQDVILKTLSTKVQVNVFLKKSGFNNAPLFVSSDKVKNMLSLISVFSGANDSGSDNVLDYTASTPSNWLGTPPTTTQQAIDRIASLLKTLNGGLAIP